MVPSGGCARRHSERVSPTLVAGDAAGSKSPHDQAPAEQLPRRYVCRKTSQTITIDGRLDEQAWKDANWTIPFIDIQGSHMPVPRFHTQAAMRWDDQNFYVAARLEEPHVWASLTEHDQIVFHDNDFELFIDPDGDRENYYEIEINALGTIFDLLLERTYIDGGPARHEWQLAGMQSAVHVDGTINDASDIDIGWTVEFALPWKSLAEHADTPSPPRPGDTWRVNFSRVQWKHMLVEVASASNPARVHAYKSAEGATSQPSTKEVYARIFDTPEDNWVWCPQGTINMHLPEHWGLVTFVE